MSHGKPCAATPRVRVSRAEDMPTPSRSAGSIRDRIRGGVAEIYVLAESDSITLGDADLVADRAWVLRIAGNSRIRICLSTPLPHHCQIVATDGSFVEVSGVATVHAYTRATVHAFDRTKVHARNRAAVSACDSAIVRAADDSVVHAYDAADVRASGRARVTATDSACVYLCEDAHAWVQRGVRVTGPSRRSLSPLSSGALVCP